MRATEGNRRVRTWRKLGGFIAAAMMALSVIGGGTASAATPSWTMVVTELPSQVKAGDVAGYKIVITNTGTSNISQVYLHNVLDKIDPPSQADPYQFLPIVYVSTSQGKCDPVVTPPPASLDASSLNCALGSIRAAVPNKFATVTVAYKSDAASSRLQLVFEAYTTGVAGDNPGSSHGDALQELGTTTFNGSNDFGGRFVTTGQEAVTNGEVTSTNPQSTKVNSPKVGIPVTVADGTQTTPSNCPATLGCWGEPSEINVDGGNTFSNGFSVEIMIFKNDAQTVHGVWHEFDADKPHFDAGGNRIFGESLAKCPSHGTPSNCFSTSKVNGNTLITVWLKENGKIAHY